MNANKEKGEPHQQQLPEQNDASSESLGAQPKQQLNDPQASSLADSGDHQTDPVEETRQALDSFVLSEVPSSGGGKENKRAKLTEEMKDIAHNSIEYAYHVTNCEYDETKAAKNKPDWEFLKANPAGSQHYDGRLTGQKVVFFSTSLYSGNLPDQSPYPQNGSIGSRYWRVKFRLTYFDSYDIWFLKATKDGDVGWIQVHLVLVRKGNNEERELMMKLQRDDENITDNLNVVSKFLRRENGSYYCNDASATRTFVNFAVLHDVPFDVKVCEWDNVQRMRRSKQQ